MNAYYKGDGVEEAASYKDGDLLIRFPNCDKESKANCELQAEPFGRQWLSIFHAQR